MKTNKWDKYHTTHYHSLSGEWSRLDVERYKQWYFSWLNYLQSTCSIFQKKLDIFEIGSGVGAMAELLREQGHNITGSDISPYIVSCANKLCAPIRFLACDIQNRIPLKKKFDVVLGLEVIEHVPDVQKALRVIHTALNDNGYFIGTTPYPFKKNFIDKTHVNVKYPDEWREEFRKAGFSDVAVHPMSFLPFLWRINKRLNPVLPFYMSWPYFVSTSLIVAKK